MKTHGMSKHSNLLTHLRTGKFEQLVSQLGRSLPNGPLPEKHSDWSKPHVKWGWNIPK